MRAALRLAPASKDLKLSPVFSAATVFSRALSPIGHWSLTTITNHRAFVNSSSSCSYIYQAIEMPATWCPIIIAFRWAFTAHQAVIRGGAPV